MSQKEQSPIAKGCASIENLLFYFFAFWIILGTVWAIVGLCCGREIAELSVRLTAREVCSTIPEGAEVYVQHPLSAFSTVSLSTAPITTQNVTQIAAIANFVTFESFQLWRLQDYVVPHPSGRYRIYVKTPPSYPVTIYFCDPDGNPLKTFQRDKTAEIKFSPDYRLLAIYEARFGNIALFDTDTLEETATIDVGEASNYVAVRSVAFHPTEPILAFTRVPRGGAAELYLWHIENNELIGKIAFSEISDNSLTFNADGTLLYFKDSAGGHIWGIPTAE